MSIHVIPIKPCYDIRARDGTWCTLPYPNHPHGCPNFPRCPQTYSDFKTLPESEWYAVIEEFNLKEHAIKMKGLYPDWTERQCRNVLYWQNSVRKRLREKAYRFASILAGDIILEIPEACGINVFETMKNAGTPLQRNPDIVKKIMFVGKRRLL